MTRDSKQTNLNVNSRFQGLSKSDSGQSLEIHMCCCARVLFLNNYLQYDLTYAKFRSLGIIAYTYMHQNTTGIQSPDMYGNVNRHVALMIPQSYSG